MEKEFLTANEVCEYLGITRVTLWNLEKQETFPKPIKVMTQKKWKKIEIDEYLEKTRRS